MEDTESLLKKNGFGADNIFHKVYIDAFTIINGKAPDARESACSAISTKG